MVFYMNAGGLKTKISDFSVNANGSIYDIIIISETWFCNNINSNELGLHNYNIFRADRNVKTSSKSRGGGVLVAVERKFSSCVVSIGVHVESIYVRLTVDHCNFIIAAVYIPPSSDKELYYHHCRDLEILSEKYPEDKLIIAGDFNLPFVNWNDCNPGSNLGGNLRDIWNIFISTYSLLNLSQVNKIPNSRNVFLDLVFTNLPYLKIDRAPEELCNSSIHHFPYSFSILTPKHNPLASSVQVYDFRNGNYNDLNFYLSSVDWEQYFDGLELDEQVNIFYEILFYAINTFIPQKIIKTRNNKYPCWFDQSLIKLCKEKKKLMLFSNHTVLRIIIHVFSLYVLNVMKLKNNYINLI